MIKKHKNFLMEWVIFGHLINYGMENRDDKNFSNIKLLTPQFQGCLIQVQDNDIFMSSNKQGEQITSSKVNKSPTETFKIGSMPLESQQKKLETYTTRAIKLPKLESKLSNQKDCNFSVSETKTNATKSTMHSSNHQFYDERNSDQSKTSSDESKTSSDESKTSSDESKTSSDESKTSSDESMKDQDSSFNSGDDNSDLYDKKYLKKTKQAMKLSKKSVKLLRKKKIQNDDSVIMIDESFSEESSSDIININTKTQKNQKYPRVMKAKTKTKQGSLIAVINDDSDNEDGSEDYRINRNIQKIQLNPKENVEMIDTSSKHQPIGQRQTYQIPLENEDLNPEGIIVYTNKIIKNTKNIMEKNAKSDNQEKRLRTDIAINILKSSIKEIWEDKKLNGYRKYSINLIIKILTESEVEKKQVNIKKIIDALIYFIKEIFQIQIVRNNEKGESIDCREYVIDDIIKGLTKSESKRQYDMLEILNNNECNKLRPIVEKFIGSFSQKNFQKSYHVLRFLLSRHLQNDPKKEDNLLAEKINLVLTKKEFEKEFDKSYEDYRQKRAIDALIDINDKDLRRFINETIKNLIDNNKTIKKEDNERYKKALIPTIIQIFKMQIDIKDYEGEDYRKYLIDELIKILTQSENREWFIFKCHDQQKAMNLIVKILIRIFPEGKFTKVNSDLENLSRNQFTKDIPREEVLENIKLFFIKKEFEERLLRKEKEFEKSYEDYKNRPIDGLIGIDEQHLRRFIDESLTETRNAIEEKIQEEEQASYIEAIQKVLIPIIIEIFKMDINIKDYEGEDYRKYLIYQLIKILTKSENRDFSIWNCLGNDQEKAMNLMVRTLMRVFPQGKIHSDLSNLNRFFKKDITQEEADSNKILFLMNKEFNKYYKSIIIGTMKKGNIPDGIQLIGKDKKDVMDLIEKKIKEIKEDDPNKREAIKKAIICIIIEMFRIPIEIFIIPNKEIDLRGELIDIMINTLNQLRKTNNNTKEHHILNSLHHDQQKAMNPMVTTVMGFFTREFKDVNHRFYHLLNTYLKGYLKNPEAQNAEAKNAGFQVPHKVDISQRNGKMSEKKLIKNTKPDVPQFPTSSSKENSVMNHPDNIPGPFFYHLGKKNCEIFPEELQDQSINDLMASLLYPKASGMDESLALNSQYQLINDGFREDFHKEEERHTLFNPLMEGYEGQKNQQISMASAIRTEKPLTSQKKKRKDDSSKIEKKFRQSKRRKMNENKDIDEDKNTNEKKRKDSDILLSDEEDFKE